MIEPLAAISGVAEAGISFSAGKPAIDLAASAALAAIADAELSIDDIDGVAVAKGGDLMPADRPSGALADYLGIKPTYIDTTLAGGVSPVLQIGHAIDAIASNRCKRVLVVYASTQASTKQRSLGGWARLDHVAIHERSTGLPSPIGPAALAAARHMWEFGTTTDQLAAVAISDRKWASLNPGALVRSELGVEEISTSPIICTPLRKIDCCLVTDGAGAVVVEGVHAAGKRAVSIVGFSEKHNHYSILSTSTLTRTAAAYTGPAAMAQAGLAPSDIGLVQLYDAFSILPIVLLEDLGFVQKGKGGSFVADGNTLPGGRLPMNTQGGGLAHCHPGYYGIFLVIEAVRQLRGEGGDRQVSNPRVALCQGLGGGAFGGSQATLLLESRA
jgi:acetyl-CoA acetyltransferase